MTIKEIECLASSFRRGIEIAHEERLFKTQPFLNFPNACCTDAPDLLAQYLMEHDLAHSIKCKYVCGTYDYDDYYHKFSHAWLEINGNIIVDITADQKQFQDEKIFPQNAFMPCFVGEYSKFHSLFRVCQSQCRDICDLRYLGDISCARMQALYETIVNCIR